MLAIYPACFYQNETADYSVIFPDLNYLATQGSTLAEAMNMAVDCLAGQLYWMEQDGDSIPAASSLTDINPAALAKELGFSCNQCFVSLISVDVEEYAKQHFNKSVKKTLSIPSWLNTAAIRHNINFSQVLQEALKEKLKNTAY